MSESTTTSTNEGSTNTEQAAQDAGKGNANEEQATTNAQTESQSADGSQFTQDEFNRLVAREKRELRAKYADYDDLKAKAEQLDAIEEAKKSELEKAQDATAKAQDEAKSWQAKFEELNAEVERRKAIDAAALEYKVDASMLVRMSGDVEENAKYLQSREEAKSKYGNVYDGGEQPAARMTLEEINAIKDGKERIRKRAEYNRAHQL